MSAPVSRKVVAGSGVGGLVTFALLEVVTTYHLNLPGNILALIGAVLVAAISFGIGYAVRHGWITPAMAAELRGDPGVQGLKGDTGEIATQADLQAAVADYLAQTDLQPLMRSMESDAHDLAVVTALPPVNPVDPDAPVPELSPDFQDKAADPVESPHDDTEADSGPTILDGSELLG